MEFITRHMEAEDKNFIYNSYLKSFHQNYPIKFVPPTIYYKGQSDVLDFLMKSANVMLAVYPEDASEIMGYVIYEYIAEVPIIHYVYVKNLSRRKYVATKLVEQILGEQKLLIYTHYVEDFPKFKYKLKGAKMVYDPFLITSRRVQEKNGNQ